MWCVLTGYQTARRGSRDEKKDGYNRDNRQKLSAQKRVDNQ